MSLTNFFFSLHALVVLACVCSFLVRYLVQKKWLRLSAGHELNLHYLLLVLTLVLPTASLVKPLEPTFTPLAKSFTAHTLR